MTLTQIKRAGLDGDALDRVFTIGASGTSAYTFQGEGLNGTVNNPTLYLTRGKTYRFENGSGGHPIRIQSTFGSSGTAYNTGVTNNAGSGTVIVEVQHDAPDVLYYQCTSHSGMNGLLYITGALADGGVTTAKLAADAVTTAKIADDAVDTAQINNNAVTNSKLTPSAVTTAKIADGAINNAKVVSNAAIAGTKVAPDFGSQNIATTGTITSTGNITTSGQINIESTSPRLHLDDTNSEDDFSVYNQNGNFLVYNEDDNRADITIASDGQIDFAGNVDCNSGLDVTGAITSTGNLTITNTEPKIFLTDSNNTSDYSIQNENGNLNLYDETNSTSRVRILSTGHVGIGTTGPQGGLHVANENTTYGKNAVFGANGWVNNANYHYTDATISLLGQDADGNNKGAGVEFTARNSGNSNWNHGALYMERDGDFVLKANGAGNYAGSEKFRFQKNGGISFNGDTASTNALDDYEEGTFSVGFTFSNQSFNGSLSTAQGHYTKIGNRCHVSLQLVVGNKGSNTSGGAMITGLPFTVYNADNARASGVVGYHQGTSGVDFPIQILVEQNQTQFPLRQAQATSANMDQSNLSNGFRIYISITYQTA